jgi:hypothetical protein
MDAADVETAAKRRARSPLQPYRPPIALLSKKERSRVSQGSVLDRLGTTPASDAVTNRFSSLNFSDSLFFTPAACRCLI